jgi:PEP-CTERM motif
MKLRIFALLIGASAIALCDGNRAAAFYWTNWPGSGATNNGTTTNNTNTGTQPTNPVPIPAVDELPEPVDPDPGIVHSPEPATLVGGLIGLGFLALMRARRTIRPREV